MFNATLRMRQMGLLSCMLGLSASTWAIDLTPDLQLHGYLTAGLAKLSNNQNNTYPTSPGAIGNPVIESATSGDYDSVAGLQLNYHLDDRIDMALQTYAAARNPTQDPGSDKYIVRTSWAYIDLHADDAWTLRGGRFALPAFLYADNLRVGEAYPWARLPPEIYAELSNLYSEDGVEVIYKHNFDNDWILRVQPSFGTISNNGYTINNIKQIAASLANDNLTLHLATVLADTSIPGSEVSTIETKLDGSLTGLGYTPAAITRYNTGFSSAIATQHIRSTFSDAGLIYDDGHVFAAGELAAMRVAGFIRDFNAGYASIGYHLGKWLPYLSYACYKDVNQDELNQIPAPGNRIYAAIANLDQHTLSLGTRYNLRKNVSLKVQADRVSGFQGNDQSGFFLPETPSATPSTLKDVYIYSVSINTVF